jgi:thiol-disulfide isomerase/thioredoxin
MNKILMALMMLLALPAQAEVLTSDQAVLTQAFASEGPVVVMFATGWCPSCHALIPKFVDVSKKLNEKINFSLVDADRVDWSYVCQGKIKKFHLVPTFIAAKNGKALCGAKQRPGSEVSDDLEGYIKKATGIK